MNPPKGFEKRVPITQAQQGQIYRLLMQRINIDSSYEDITDVPCLLVHEYRAPRYYAVVLVGDELIRLGGDYSYQSTNIKTWLEIYDEKSNL
jgi:hypothetical protein